MADKMLTFQQLELVLQLGHSILCLCLLERRYFFKDLNIGTNLVEHFR